MFDGSDQTGRLRAIGQTVGVLFDRHTQDQGWGVNRTRAITTGLVPQRWLQFCLPPLNKRPRSRLGLDDSGAGADRLKVQTQRGSAQERKQRMVTKTICSVSFSQLHSLLTPPPFKYCRPGLFCPPKVKLFSKRKIDVKISDLHSRRVFRKTISFGAVRALKIQSKR